MKINFDNEDLLIMAEADMVYALDSNGHEAISALALRSLACSQLVIARTMAFQSVTTIRAVEYDLNNLKEKKT